MANDLTRVRKVQPLDGGRVRVRFEGERAAHEIDLTGLLARSRHLSALLQDSEAFAKAEIMEDGLGIAWPIETKWGRLDVSAATLKRIAVAT